MLHTRNRIEIEAPPELIYELAADVERWPQLLQHYRYVRVIERSPASIMPATRLVEMGACRSRIPVSWTSMQELRPKEHQIFYHHVGGVTRGMKVLWQIRSENRACEVTIDHELNSPTWWMRTPVAEYVVGQVFVLHVANQTLRGIKRHAESLASRWVSS